MITLLLVLCVFVGCQVGEEPVETQPNGETSAMTEAITEAITEASNETSAQETTQFTETQPEEETTTPPTPWEQDTGIFNAGVVEYQKEVVTEVIVAYPDEKIGQVMASGEQGVINVFHADFEDNDPIVGGEASFWKPGFIAAGLPGKVGCHEGKLYLSYDENKANLIGDKWNVWSPNVGTSVKNYKQVQFSLDWNIVTTGNGAWLNPIIGCYVKNYASKIPDNPGDGLWIAFNASGDSIHVYHPQNASWPSAWASVSMEKGMLSGQNHVDVITTHDYSTYVYVTPEGGDTARLVCTIKFADGKIRVYNGANEMVKEADCNTSVLQGEHFSIFSSSGGAIIDGADVYVSGASETKTHTTITAIPMEGQSLGLDITDKTDLVSICYSIWFDAILGQAGGKVDNWYNVSEVLAGKAEWGPSPQFHYWAKPAQGYYASSNKDVIRTHMTQLYTAGVDFIILDLTNAHDGYLGSAEWTTFIQQPMDALLETIMEMRAEGLGTPYVVMWVGDWVGESKGPLYQKLYDDYYSQEKWKDCFVYWDGKPFMMTAMTQPDDFPLKDKDLFTVRSMWGLHTVDFDRGQWSYLSENNYCKYSKAADGSPEHMGVCVASQQTYMSNTNTAHGRQGGMFWYAQWLTAFEVRPKIITLTWWNEWTAQRLSVNGGYEFTDNYNQEFSRDIEPMEGGHGDQYYQWMIQYIAAYKGHMECPVLVEASFEKRVDRFIKDYRENHLHSYSKRTIDLATYGACAGSITVTYCSECDIAFQLNDYQFSCPVDIGNAEVVEKVTDEKGNVHEIKRVECPDCDLFVEIEVWNDGGKHKIIRVYVKDKLIVAVKE